MKKLIIDRGEGNEELYLCDELAKEFTKFQQQYHSPDKLNEWLRNNQETYRISKQKKFAKQKAAINRNLTASSNDYGITAKKGLESVKRYSEGLMRDSSFRDDIVRAYYYLILDKPLDSIDVNAMRQNIGTTFDEMQHIQKIPKEFTNVKTARQYLSQQLDFLQHKCIIRTVLKTDELIQRATNFVLRQQNLNGVCTPLIIAYLANPFAGEMQKISELVTKQLAHSVRVAEIINIDDNSITIKYQKDITRKEYLNIWKHIESNLDSDYRDDCVDLLKLRLAYLNYEKKMPQSQIAKTYYPEYYDRGINGKENAEDLVRHAIKQCDLLCI